MLYLDYVAVSTRHLSAFDSCFISPFCLKMFYFCISKVKYICHGWKFKKNVAIYPTFPYLKYPRQLTHNGLIVYEKKQQQKQGKQDGPSEWRLTVINPHSVTISQPTPFFIRCARLISYICIFWAVTYTPVRLNGQSIG